MSYEYDEVYAVYDECFPRARKPHTCAACKETIPAGHHYARVGIVDSEGANTVKRCMRCQRIHEHLRTLDPGTTWPDERLNCGETYRDEWGDDPPPEIAALAFALPGEIAAEGREGER